MEKTKFLDLTAVKLPNYSQWTSDKLMLGTPGDFAKMLFQRAKRLGDDLYDYRAYEITPLDEATYKENVINYMRRRAWSEWYCGTVSPARQISLLPNNDKDLQLRIARQIKDELRHFDLFVTLLKKYGAEVRLNEFQLPALVAKMKEIQLEMGTAPEIAATNQYAGEVVLSSMADPQNSIFAKILDRELFNALLDMERDEPPHVANGRDLVLMFCETFDQRRRLAEAQERYLKILIQVHSAEIEKLGSRRIRPLPGFE